MELDRSILMESYLAENSGRVDSVFNCLSLLKKNPQDEENLIILLRELHTLKGSSRMMGIRIVETLSQSTEDVFKSFRDKKIEFTDQIYALVLVGLENISISLKEIEAAGYKYEQVETEKITRIKENLKKASEGEKISLDDSLDDAQGEIEQSSEISNIKTVNVKLSSVDDILGKFDTVLLRHFKFKYFLKELSELTKNFFSSELNSLLYELNFDFSKQEEEMLALQQSIFTLKMLPLNIILTSVRKNMEMEVLKSDKKVTIDIPPSDVVLDKDVLEAISDSILHIVRNSFSHGIELPEERRKKGKNETGLISVRVQSSSSKITIRISDDGQGIDFEAIRKKAMKLFPEEKESIAGMDYEDLEQYLYKSGLSTKKKADEFSGRGVGLDVVKSNIDRIKGKISVETEQDKGTTFILTFPFSFATMHGLFIQCNSYKLFLPASYIREVVHVENIGKKQYIKVRDEKIPVHDLEELIASYDETSVPKNDGFHTVIIIDTGLKLEGIKVTKVFSTSTLIVQKMPPIFSFQKILSGIVSDENYDMVPILDIPNLMEIFETESKKVQKSNKK